MKHYEQISKSEFYEKGGFANDGMARIKNKYYIIDKNRYIDYLNDIKYWG